MGDEKNAGVNPSLHAVTPGELWLRRVLGVVERQEDGDGSVKLFRSDVVQLINVAWAANALVVLIRERHPEIATQGFCCPVASALNNLLDGYHVDRDTLDGILDLALQSVRLNLRFPPVAMDEGAKS